MRTVTLLLAMVMLPSGSWASPFTLGSVGFSGNNAIASVCGIRIADCSFVTVTDANFNAQSVDQLRANYDVLFFGYDTPAFVNADWTTRLAPYLASGGGVIFESPQNVSDLLPAVVGTEAATPGTLAITTVPLLTLGLPSTMQVVNSHISFSTWSSLLSPFLREFSGETVGLYGTVGAGRIVLTGPDNSYHGVDIGSSPADNMYELLANEVRWVAAAQTPTTPVPEPTTLLLTSLGAAGWGVRKARRKLGIPSRTR